MNLLYRILSRFPHFDICSNDGDIYMRRHKVLQCRFGNVYLHHIRRGDRDRCLHDHPWSFVSIVLAGGYFEELMVRGERRRFWRRPGMVMWRPAKTAHRVQLRHIAPKRVSWSGPVPPPFEQFYRWWIQRAANPLGIPTAHLRDISSSERAAWTLVFTGPRVRRWGFYTIFGWRPFVPGQGSPICEREA